MKIRLLTGGLAVMSAALVACGGGGSSGGPPPTPVPTATATVTPAPTPTPTLNPYGCSGSSPLSRPARNTMAVPRPIGAGDTFTYTGTLHHTYAQSAPCAQPTATSSASVSATISDSPTSAPDGTSATASTQIEQDAYATHTEKLTTAQVLQLSVNALLLYSSTTSDTTGNSIETAYAHSQQIDDLGAGGTWTNNPAATITEALSDGGAVTRKLASDGSYTDTQTYSDGVKNTITVNGAATGTALDGAGSYDLGAGLKCGGEVSFAYAPPAGGNITLTITSYQQKTTTNVCQTVTATRTFPAWFAKPQAYVTDTFADNGTKALDASCSTPIATSGTQIIETYNVLDPVLGYTETRTTTSYDVSGYGPVCVVIVDTLNSYYDYADDTTKIDYQSHNGQPNAVDTIAETLGMQSAACASGSPPCAQLRRIQSARAISLVAIAGRLAAIDEYRAVQREQRVQALRRFALRFAHKGAAR